MTGLRGIGDEPRWIAGTPWRIADLDRAPGHALRGIDDFLHAETVSITQIEHIRLTTPLKVGERQEMRLAKIPDMDIIADAGSIRGVVVASKDLDCPASSGRRLQNERDQMGFRRVPLPQQAVRIGAGGIEIA